MFAFFAISCFANPFTKLNSRRIFICFPVEEPSCLLIDGVETHTDENRKNHHTDEYENQGKETRCFHTGCIQGCTAVGDGRASPTTKVYEFWFFYHQSVRILVFLPPKCTNFSFFYETVRILGRHVTSRTPLAVHPWMTITTANELIETTTMPTMTTTILFIAITMMTN